MTPKIFNLSNLTLNEHQINVLKKGLKFTPTPKRNVHELKRDIEQFTRKLRLVEFFSEEENSNDTSLVKNKSNFHPPRDRDKTLDTVCDFLNKQNFEKNTKRKANISKNEEAGINLLKNNNEIIIKEADKGGAVVIMNKNHYKKMVMDHLNDKKTYKKVTKSCDNNTMTELKRLTEKFKNELTQQEIKYLTNFSFKTSNFYGLPKIHKSKLIKAAIENQNNECIQLLEPADLKLRPITIGPT